EKVSISGPVDPVPLVRAKLDPPAPGDKRGAYHLHVEIGPFPGPGDITSNLQLATTDPNIPRLPVVVVALAASGPVVSPRQIYLMNLAAGDKGKDAAHLQVFTRSGQLHLL